MAALKAHLAGVSEYSDSSKRSVREVFDIILKLEVGEALLFSPTAMMEVKNDKVERLGTEFVKMRTRKRVTKDGGKSVMGVEVDLQSLNFSARAETQRDSQSPSKSQTGQQMNGSQQQVSNHGDVSGKQDKVNAASGEPGIVVSNKGKGRAKDVQGTDH